MSASAGEGANAGEVARAMGMVAQRQVEEGLAVLDSWEP